MSEMIREEMGGGLAGKASDGGLADREAEEMTLGDWMSPPARKAPDSAAILAGALEDIALRLQRHEDRVAKALEALDVRLEHIENRPAPDASPSADDDDGLRGEIKALGDRLGTIGGRVEDLSDSVAAVSGDIEETRRGLERSHEETARLAERVDAQDGAPAASTEGLDDIRRAIRELASQIKSARDESTKIGIATEKAMRELGRRGQEAAAAQQDATGKVGRALSVIAARVEMIERADADRNARLDRVEGAISAAEESLDTLSPDGVSPHVAKVEREIAAFNASARDQGEARADVFDRIAARAESAYESKRKAREGGLGGRAAALGQQARARADGAAPEKAPAAPPADPPSPSPASAAPPADEPPAAVSFTHTRPPEPSEPPAAERHATRAPEPEVEPDDPVGELTVRPGSTAQAKRRSRKQREQSFEDAFEGTEDDDAEPPSIASIRQRFRGGEEADTDEGLDLVAAFDDQGRDGGKGGGLIGRILGIMRRGKPKRAVARDDDEDGDDGDEFGSVDIDDDDDPYAVFDDPDAAPKKGRKAKGRKARSKSRKRALDDEDELDLDDDWAEETGRARSSGLKVALLVLLIIAALAVGHIMTQGDVTRI